MTNLQKLIIKDKLPSLLLTLIEYHSVNEVKESINCTHFELLSWIGQESFPTHEQLKRLCERFKIDYNTAKTWRLYSTN